MVKITDKYIYIKNDVLSIVISIRKDGKLEMIHFGDIVLESDIDSLTLRPELGWGDSVLYTQKDTSSCLERIPMFYSDAGRGDYRETPIELSFIPDFVFEYAKLVDTIEKTKSGMPLSKDPNEVIKIQTRSLSSDVLLVHYISVFETAIGRRCELVNLSDKEIEVTKIASMMIDIKGEYEFLSFGGGWIAEAHEDSVRVGQSRVVNESTYGFSSSVHNSAVVLLEDNATLDNGNAIGINLVYTGNHYTSAQKSSQGLNRIVAGISPDHFSDVLSYGESFESPECILSFSSQGRNGLSKNMHAFVNRHIVPRYWQYRERPVLFNNWEGTMFNFNEKKLVSLAKKASDLGCELFVLDDGWFSKRDNDEAGLGDYNVNTKKLPSGIEGVAKKIRSFGMEFGLWFEPEAVNPNSNLYAIHPDWAIHQENLVDLYGRNELLLDLRKKEVRDYIVENVGKIIDENSITYVKWDMNRQGPLLGIEAHKYILGLYDVLSRIFETRPKVLLESCSSGGNRFDLGMLSFGPQAWASDDTDPIERLDIQGGLSLMYPQSTWGSHVSASPHAQTLRATPLSTRFNVAAFGCLGYELDLAFLSSAEEKEVKEQIEYYKAYKKLFQFGEFRRNDFPNGVNWQVTKGEESVVGIFHRLVHAAPEYEYLKAKVKEGSYHLVSKGQSLRIGSFGPLIKHISPVAIDPNGSIMGMADKNIRLKDAVEDIYASDRALSSGIPICNMFLGTGYSKEMRMQGDFGSNLFYIARE